jgi:hypothetical protein
VQLGVAGGLRKLLEEPVQRLLGIEADFLGVRARA